MRRMKRIGEEHGSMYGIRQVLNTLFVISVIIGIVLYLKVDRNVGTYTLIGACVLKFVEVTLRLMKI